MTDPVQRSRDKDVDDSWEGKGAWAVTPDPRSDEEKYLDMIGLDGTRECILDEVNTDGIWLCLKNMARDEREGFNMGHSADMIGHFVYQALKQQAREWSERL